MAPPSHIFDPSGDVLLVLTIRRTSSINNKSVTFKDEVEVQVSSRHLALASQFFRAMFDGNFAERIEPGDVLKRVPLPDDDANAMVILLHIIHGQLRQAPKTVPMRTFVAIGVLVDKYGLHEVSEIFTTRWFDALWSKAEFQSSSGLVNWIFLSWIFKRAMEFAKVTKHAILNGPKDLHDHGLPLPDATFSKLSLYHVSHFLTPYLIAEIDSRRKLAVHVLFDYFDGVITHYGASQAHICMRHPACDVFVLGDLIKNLGSAGISPMAGPENFSTPLNTAYSTIRKTRFTSLCKVLNIKQKDEHLDEGLKLVFQKCSLKRSIRKETAWQENAIRGLRLTFMDGDEDFSEDDSEDLAAEEDHQEYLRSLTEQENAAANQHPYYIFPPRGPMH